MVVAIGTGVSYAPGYAMNYRRCVTSAGSLLTEGFITTTLHHGHWTTWYRYPVEQYTHTMKPTSGQHIAGATVAKVLVCNALHHVHLDDGEAQQH